MTGSSISAAIPVRTFPGRRVILYAPARPGTHSLSMSFFGSGFWRVLPDTPAEGFQTGEGAQQRLVSGAPL